MYVKINDKTIPKKTLQAVTLELGGNSYVRGEAIGEIDRMAVEDVLNSLKDGDTVEFDVQTNSYKQHHGAAYIRGLKVEQRPAGTLTKLAYSFMLEYIH
jgi:hypothetical protein